MDEEKKTPAELAVASREAFGKGEFKMAVIYRRRLAELDPSKVILQLGDGTLVYKVGVDEKTGDPVTEPIA